MSEMLNIELHTHGTTRFALCFGNYAVKFARGSRGRAANRAENVEWERATPERREMLCPMLWASPFGLFNLMQRAVPLTRTQQLALLERDGFPDWDYMPGGLHHHSSTRKAIGVTLTVVLWRSIMPSQLTNQ
jgi:hypothetical protein